MKTTCLVCYGIIVHVYIYDCLFCINLGSDSSSSDSSDVEADVAEEVK